MKSSWKVCSAFLLAVALLLGTSVGFAVEKDCKPDRACKGTSGSDTLRGRGGGDRIYGFNGSDLLYGGQGEDLLFGGAGDDRIQGNEDGDGFWGGRGDDLLKGGRSGDSFEFDPGWGQDTILDIPSLHNTVFLWDVRQDLLVRLHGNRTRHEVEVVDGRATVDWVGNLINIVYGGGGDDTIWGSSRRNRIIVVQGGSDIVYAGRGEDSVNAEDPDGGGPPDVVDCGRGRDTVWYDNNDTIKNCERRNPDTG